ncbi:MAG TPA: hypothetical protein VHR41_01785 [Gemmatimonadales bacterium]|jgi:hypothetical protein|nr:hypothetical protein [Gemmatimonadales bacterium]
MEDPVQPIQIPLTDEQQALIKRLSGQFAQVLELVPDPADSAAGAGRGLQFRWRLSTTSGIPRQNWGFGDQPKPAPDADPSS